MHQFYHHQSLNTRQWAVKFVCTSVGLNSYIKRRTMLYDQFDYISYHGSHVFVGILETLFPAAQSPRLAMILKAWN